MRCDDMFRTTIIVVASALVIGWSPPVLADADAPGGARSAAVDVVFVLDNSGSMKENDPDRLARAAVGDFAAALAEAPEIDGRIGVVLFDGEARVSRPLSPLDPAAEAAGISASLDALDFSGQRTNGPAGIERALYEFRQNGRDDARRAIVFLTDGQIDTGDAGRDREAARWLREDLAGESEARGIRIFGVAFTDAADYRLIQALARRTDASYYRAFDAADLQGVVDDVLDRIVGDDANAMLAGDPDPTDSESSPMPEAVNVATAPVQIPPANGLPLWALLPAVALLVAGALVWRSRRRHEVQHRGSSTPPDDMAAPRDPDAARLADAPPAQLLDLDGRLGRAGAPIDLSRARTRIGRDPHNELAFDGVDSISSEHAVIEYRNGHYWIEDLRSTNGTLLDGELLVAGRPTQLKGGDRIRLADIELMFVLAGYAPRGETVFLDPTTTPPDATAPDATPPDASPPATDESSGADDAWTDASELEDERTLPPSPNAEEAARPRAGQLSLLRSEEADAPSSEPSPPPSAAESSGVDGVVEPAMAAADAPPDDEPATDAGIDEVRAIRANLDDHLRRVEALSGAFALFVQRAFDREIRDAVAVSARDLVAEASADQRIARKRYTFDGVRFVLCGIPGSVERARGLFVESFGGFTRLLGEELHADSFRSEGCEVLAVLTFGLDDAPWVSLSIVPDEGHDPRIDLLSYELLTEEERHEIEVDGSTELSQSGLG